MAASGRRIAALREIVETHTAGPVPDGDDYTTVDAFTASMLVTVHDALSPENQARFDQPDLMRLIDVGWSSVALAPAGEDT